MIQPNNVIALILILYMVVFSIAIFFLSTRYRVYDNLLDVESTSVSAPERDKLGDGHANLVGRLVGHRGQAGPANISIIVAGNGPLVDRTRGETGVSVDSRDT